MPDIDIDFDDEGRGRVMDYVKKSMVQIRWLKLSLMVRWRPNRQFEIPLVYWIYLFEADRIAKLIPAMMPSKWNLARFISESEDEVKKALKSSEEFDKIRN
jgi:DNA polymerase-3 subunit alpha